MEKDQTAGHVRSSAAIYAARQGLIFVISTFVHIYITKHLNSEVFGKVTIFNSIVLGVGLFADSGFYVSFIKEKDQINHLVIRKLFGLHIIIATALLLLFIPFHFFKVIQTNFISPFILFAIIMCFFNGLQSSIYSKFQKEINIIPLALNDIISNLIYNACLVILVIKGWGVDAILYSYALKSLITYIIANKHYGQLIIPDFQIFSNSFLKKVKVGILNQSNYLISFIRSLLNPIILGTFIGIKGMGLADRAVFLCGVPTGILNLTIQKVLFPYFSNELNNTNDISYRLKKSVLISSIADKIYFIPFIVLIDSFVLKFLGLKWDGLQPLCYIIAVGNAIFGAPSSVMTSALMGLGKFKTLVLLNIIQLLLLWPVAIFLTKFFGLTGYAFTSSFTWLFTIPLIFLLKKEIKKVSIAYESIFPIVISATTIAFGFYIKEYLKINHFFLEMIVISTLLTFTYIIMILLLEKKYIPGEIKEFRKKLNF